MADTPRKPPPPELLGLVRAALVAAGPWPPSPAARSLASIVAALARDPFFLATTSDPDDRVAALTALLEHRHAELRRKPTPEEERRLFADLLLEYGDLWSKRQGTRARPVDVHFSKLVQRIERMLRESAKQRAEDRVPQPRDDRPRPLIDDALNYAVRTESIPERTPEPQRALSPSEKKRLRAEYKRNRSGVVLALRRHGLKHGEIAALVDSSPAAVRQIAARATRRTKKTD